MGRSGYVPPPVFLLGKTVKGRPEATHGSKAEDSDYFAWTVTRWPFKIRISHEAWFQNRPFYWKVHLIWNEHDRVEDGQGESLEEAARMAEAAVHACVRDVAWLLQNTPADEDSPGSVWDRILRDDRRTEVPALPAESDP